MSNFGEDFQYLIGAGGQPRLAAGIEPYLDRSAAHERIVSVACAAEIGTTRTLALILKFEHEKKREAGANADEATSHLGVLRKVFADRIEPAAGQSQEMLVLLVGQIVLSRAFLLPTQSRELAYIEQDYRDECEALQCMPAPVVEGYLASKRAWLHRATAVRELGRINRQLLARSQSISNEFMALFGPEYLEARSQAARLQVAQQLLELLKEHPGLTLAELEALARRRAASGEERLDPDELRPARRSQPNRNGGRGNSAEAYKQGCGLLRKIAMLCHPDRLASGDIPWLCRERLAAIWHETNALRAQKSNQELIAEHAGKLQQMLLLVRHILTLADVGDIDPAHCIAGRTLEERMDWLTREARELGIKISRERLRLAGMNSDEELRYMQSMLAADETQRASELELLRSDATRMHREAEKIERFIELQSYQQVI